ncbi:hypothetical protein [Jonesia denitrificans]|uniref:Uncharacterized protein n=1 Tax=Jonesia denitrificans (strain ATCC 14870 / DSM 20603 / BCRC 15368 / CIP 55.134 / JCM 11481 / NBRC 15587 / NCTC 10816 / Prevot 55134) TaxID=471856 RepID=C7R1F8_JONDD|nr:hypothetical protein [Jonesia denitrificans]ACV09793.1 hypothetical protein Jden_2156 [Jonesia denitrificans DSM 20603]ACV09931.1 hypothetical protein Jden_2296 [Jonesia denitrificans DSM 20603]QXB43434.1 hypothetical protein I6L70_00490 [Jonesia denitrificans]QXB43552.1 hypothetical protein I6L70_01205 [Jonesia denitrificans]SQH22422.1 Uncharacterised protein [Jonesia denitrificans]
MTRAHVKRPVWAWHCDRCGVASGDFAYNQQYLPTPDEMRARGWYIAEKWGDLCAHCSQTPPIEEPPS